MKGPRALILALAAATGLILLIRVRAVLFPFALGGALAYVLNPVVCAFERRAVPRGTAILLVYLLLAAVAYCMAVAVGPRLAQEAEEILEQLPQRARELEGWGEGTARELARLPWPGGLAQLADGVLTRLEQLAARLAGRVVDLLATALPGLFSLALAPFLAYFLLRDWEHLGARALRTLPPASRAPVRAVLADVDGVLHRFLRGQVLVSLAVGAAVALGLMALGVPYALLVGLIAGLFDIVPYFGPLIGAVPAVALGWMESPVTALWVILLLVAVNQLEGALLSPRIMAGQVGLHPLVVIFAVLAGGELAGILGMLLAVPAAATLRVLWKHYRRTVASA